MGLVEWPFKIRRSLIESLHIRTACSERRKENKLILKKSSLSFEQSLPSTLISVSGCVHRAPLFVLAAQHEGPICFLAWYSVILQALDVTIAHRFLCGHSGAVGLSITPIEFVQAVADGSNDAFFGTLSIGEMVTRQRSNSEHRLVITYFNALTKPPRALKCVFSRWLFEKMSSTQPTLSLMAGGRSRSCGTTYSRKYFRLTVIIPLLKTSVTAERVEKLRVNYYWTHVPTDVIHYTKSFRQFQRRKKPPTLPAGFLQLLKHGRLRPTKARWILGSFALPKACNHCIIVATNYSIRYTET